MSEKKQAWNARSSLLLGYGTLAFLVFGLGAWSVTANIAGAIIASGQLEVEGKRQVIQHPDGGVVGEINVDDGDFVQAGDILLRLDDRMLRSELAITEGQLFEILVRRDRLMAERDGLDNILFSQEVRDIAADNPAIIELMAGQERLFSARQDSKQREAEQLEERKIQIENQIEGTEAQMAALNQQLGFVGDELRDKQELLAKDLIQRGQVLALQREEARLRGTVGELKSSIAENRGRIAEIDIEIVKLDSRIREEAITTMRDLQYREIELKEKRLSTLETLSRLDVRAPVSGIIYGKTVFAVRSVIRPADPIMFVVPQDTSLIISSRIETIHIDQVHPGQDASLRFATFDQRTTPEIFGKVVKVSADVFSDDKTGQSYYTAEILPNEGEIERLGEVEILPGMPVEAFIKTADRTPFNYLVKPLTDYFNKAFRET